jgi:hypothetical protein
VGIRHGSLHSKGGTDGGAKDLQTERLLGESALRPRMVVRRDARTQAMRMPVDDFAIPRGATEPIRSKQTAERVWEPNFVAEIMAGRNPRVSPVAATSQTSETLTVAGFLDRYFTEYVEAEAIKRAATVAGHLKALKTSLGELPTTALEKPPRSRSSRPTTAKAAKSRPSTACWASFGRRSTGGASRIRHSSQPPRFIDSASPSDRMTKRSATDAFTATRNRRCSPHARR